MREFNVAPNCFLLHTIWKRFVPLSLYASLIRVERVTKRRDSAQPTAEAELERSPADFSALDRLARAKTDPVSQIPRQGFGEDGMADCPFLRFQCGHRPSRTGNGSGTHKKGANGLRTRGFDRIIDDRPRLL